MTMRRPLRPFRLESLERRELMTADPGWAFGLGGPAIESESAVNVGPDRNVYVTGSFAGTIDLDPGPGTANFTAPTNLQDGFIAKYTPERQLIWAKTFGGTAGTPGHELSRDIEFDAAGDVYLAGISGSTTPTFGGITLANQGSYDIFVAKVDAANGNFLWAKRVGGTGNDLGYDLDVNANGEVYVAAHFDGTVDFDPSPTSDYTLTSNGESDGFLWKLDTLGNFVWVHRFGGVGNDTAHRVSVGDDGFVYVNGTFRESIDFGQPGMPLTLTNPTGSGTSNIYVAKLAESNGDAAWARQIGGMDRTNAARVIADGQGALYIAGGFEGTLDFGDGTTPLVSAGIKDAFLTKWDTNGNVVWAEQVGGSGDDTPRNLTLDANGNLVALVSFESTADFDPGVGTSTLTSADQIDSALLRLDANGGFVSVRQFAGPGVTEGDGVIADASGNVYVSGFFQNSVALPTGDAIARSGNSNFLMKIAPVAPTKFYVVDGVARTHEYDLAGNREDNYALGAGNTAPRGAASNVAGDKVWVIDANKKVYVYNNAGGLLGSWTASGLSSPQGIATNGTDVWIVDSSTDKVYKYTGAASRLAGSQSAASSFNLNNQNGGATDLVTDGASIWVVNSAATDKVFKYTMAGSLLGSWTIDSRNSSPTGITLDPSSPSTLWIVDNATDQVFAYAGATTRTSGSQAATIAVNLGLGNSDPQGIADPPAIGDRALLRLSPEIVESTNNGWSPLVSQAASHSAIDQVFGTLASDEQLISKRNRRLR